MTGRKGEFGSGRWGRAGVSQGVLRAFSSPLLLCCLLFPLFSPLSSPLQYQSSRAFTEDFVPLRVVLTNGAGILTSEERDLPYTQL